MLSGKLSPSTTPLTEIAPRDDGPDMVRRRAVDGGTDVLSVRSSQVVHGVPRRAMAAAGHAHHAHLGHPGASQAERVIATVARNIVVSGDDGNSMVMQDVEQVVLLCTGAAPPVAEVVDDEEGIDSDDATARADAAPLDGATTDRESVADSSRADRPTSSAGSGELDLLALDGVQEARGRDGVSASGANADGSSGGWGGGGALGSRSVRATETVEAASAAASVRATGADHAAIARIERLPPARRVDRAQTPHEHKVALMVGIGLVAAVVVLVLALLVSFFSSPAPSARGEDSEEAKQGR